MEPTARIECLNTRQPQLFDLKWDLLIALFRDWMEMKDVAMFDTAVCNREYRQQYLSLLSSGEITFKGSGKECIDLNGDCLEWLVARKVGIRGLSCSLLNRSKVADVTGRMLLKIARLSGPSLTTLCLRNWNEGITTTLMSQIVSICSNIEILRYVNCSKNLINDAMVMSACSKLSNLKNIDVSDCNISDRSLKILASHCPMLKNVDFAFCTDITDAGLKALARGCPCLEYANLRLLHYITDEGVIAIARGCRQLRHLRLCQCHHITDKSIREVAMLCPLLEVISLSFCHHLTSATLEVLADHSEHLCQIYMSGCWRMTEPSLIYFLEKRGSKLCDIELGFPKFVTDASLFTIAHMCPKLRWFSLKSNLITDNGVVELIKSCEFLYSLVLCSCTNLSNVILDAISCHSVHLEYLHIQGCHLMTRKCLNRLQDKKPDLLINDSDDDEDVAEAAVEEENEEVDDDDDDDD